MHEKLCPNCRAHVREEAVLCDCGYNFDRHEVALYPSAEELQHDIAIQQDRADEERRRHSTRDLRRGLLMVLLVYLPIGIILSIVMRFPMYFVIGPTIGPAIGVIISHFLRRPRRFSRA